MARKKESRKYQTNLKLITCIVQRGKADNIVKAAMTAGAPAATIYFARGTGIRERLGLLKIFISPEKEVVEMVIPNEVADKVLDAVVEAGELDIPGMGFAYMTSVDKALMLGSSAGTVSESDLGHNK